MGEWPNPVGCKPTAYALNTPGSNPGAGTISTTSKGVSMKKRLVALMLAGLLTFGCAGATPPISSKVDLSQVAPLTKQSTAGHVAAVIDANIPNVQTAAYLLDDVYAFLVKQKVVGDHTVLATKALAGLDTIAPIVKNEAHTVAGDKFNWVTFVLQSAIAIAQILGYVLPIVLPLL